MDDLISRKAAIDAIEHRLAEPAYLHRGEDWYVGMNCAEFELYALQSVQTEQTKMIKEIREWINSGNRGNADYFIVDKIEGIINRYE